AVPVDAECRSLEWLPADLLRYRRLYAARLCTPFRTGAFASLLTLHPVRGRWREPVVRSRCSDIAGRVCSGRNRACADAAAHARTILRDRHGPGRPHRLAL